MATKIINGIVIHTSFDYPPIPVRWFDWSAVLDSYDGAPDAGWQPIGIGPTEADAVADLLDQIADRIKERL